MGRSASVTSVRSGTGTGDVDLSGTVPDKVLLLRGSDTGTTKRS